MNIDPAYILKHDSNHENQIILLMISNRERWHYLSVKTLSALLREITSKHDGDFYCFNCLHSFRTKNNLQSHRKLCELKDFCGVVIPPESTKILQFNQYGNLIRHHLLFMQVLNV